MKKKKICSRCSRSLFWIYFALFRVWNLPQPLLQLGFTHEQKKKEKNNSFRSILDPSSGCHECGYQVVWQFVHKSWTTNKKCLCQTSNWCQRKVLGESGRIIILEYIPTHVETVQFKPNLNPPWRHPLDCPLLFWRLKFCIIIFEPQVTVFGQEGWAGEDILIKTD